MTVKSPLARENGRLEWRLTVLDTIDSTNAEAIRRAKAGEPAGFAISASAQTAGRGRSGRVWSTAGTDLALSVLLRPALAPAAAAAGSFVAALAVADFAASHLPASSTPKIKWPNDVMIGDGKLSGILLEATGGGDGKVEWLVIGMGVNLAPADRPAAANPIDIHSAGGPVLTTRQAADGLLAALGQWIDIWLDQGFAPIRDAWRSRARDLGQQVMARLPNETVYGVARDLAVDGALILDLPNGQERRIAAGDVFPLEARG